MAVVPHPPLLRLYCIVSLSSHEAASPVRVGPTFTSDGESCTSCLWLPCTVLLGRFGDACFARRARRADLARFCFLLCRLAAPRSAWLPALASPCAAQELSSPSPRVTRAQPSTLPHRSALIAARSACDSVECACKAVRRSVHALLNGVTARASSVRGRRVASSSTSGAARLVEIPTSDASRRT